MDDWTRATAARLRREIEERQLEEEKYVAAHKIRLSLGPDLWKELRHWVGQHCSDLNAAMGQQILSFEPADDAEIRVRSHLGGHVRHLHAKFDEDTGIIQYDGGSYPGVFEVEMLESGMGILTSRRTPRSVDDAGREMLGSVLDMPPLRMR
jgi:hypothetical protein